MNAVAEKAAQLLREMGADEARVERIHARLVGALGATIDLDEFKALAMGVAA